MDVGAVRSRRRRGAMSEPSPTQAVNDRAVARAREEITRRTAEGEFGQPPNTDLRDRAWMEIFEQELSNRHPRTMGRPLLSSFFRRARLRSDPLTRGDLAAVVSTRSHSSRDVRWYIIVKPDVSYYGGT